MNGRGRQVAALLGALMVASLAACGTDRQEGAQAGPLITIADDWDDFPTAEVTGPLDEQDGCLLIGGNVVFWPKGTTWDADARTVEQTDGSKVAVGEPFDGGGGSYDPATDFGELLGSTEAADRVAACVDETAAREVLVATP